MSATSVPTSTDIQKAAQSDSSECQKLVLQIIEYGTNDCQALEERTQQVCNVLADAWEHCLDLEDILVDVLWLKSSLLASTESSPSKTAFVEVLKCLAKIPRPSFFTKLQGNLQPGLVEACGLGPEQELLKKLKMHNTQVHYKQQKYNLLQEESEGYSKVLNFFMTQEPNDPLNSRSKLLQLIGTFELDPNRLLDLLIDILEQKLYPNGLVQQVGSSRPKNSPQVSWILNIMQEFSIVTKLQSLISFKLSSETEPSQTLLRTIAFLASSDLLDLNMLVKNFLGPVEDKIQETHRILWMKEKKRIQGLARISLSGTSKENPEVAKLNERFRKSLVTLEKNDCLRILLILLEWGEWNRVKPILKSDVWGHLCTILPEKFGGALCDVAQQLLNPWYDAKVGSPGLSKPWKVKNAAAEDNALTLDEVIIAVSDPLMCTARSGYISYRPILFCQLCRLFKCMLSDEETEGEVSNDMYDFLKTILIPSLSLFPSNPALSTELWGVLKLLPYATRYRLYDDWRGSGLENAGLNSSSAGKPLPNVESEIRAGKAARYVLKRLSKDNIREMSRQLSKVVHSNPLVVFSTILQQIESYDNMVEVMVEAQRFVNPLGLDVLGYCILSRLSGTTGGVNRSRLKEDGVNVSQWLQSLETFSGAFFKRFAFVELRGILCYLMRRLKDGNVMELGILRTLLKVPGGYSFADYSPAASLSNSQLVGRAGSITLKRETMSFGIVEEVNTYAAERIRHALQTDGFGVAMLILISQVRSRILFESASGSPKEVKLVGNLYDSCQVVMSILLEFLTGSQESEDDNEEVSSSIIKYAENLPTMTELHTKFGFDAASMWMLCRPLVRAATIVAEGEDENACKKLKGFTMSLELRSSLKDILPESIWSSMSSDLFESFYSNSLHDLCCPSGAYRSEISRLNKEIERIQSRLKTGTPSALHTGPSSQRNETDELERLKSVSQKLETDLNHQEKHVRSILDDMEEKKDILFKSPASLEDLARTLLVQCIFPRSTQSPDDAMYCAHFVYHLHKIETPGFSTLHYIDELISVVSGAFFGVTEGEAANLAILLWETWKIVNRWRYEEDAFNAEVLDKPGSLMSKRGFDVNGTEENGICAIAHKEFVALYNTWHASLGAGLIGCLQSPEYMHTRAGLVLLTRLVEVFPTRPKLGNRLLQALSPLQEESSSRLDIRASANAYGTMLLKARDEGKWIEEDAAVAKARAEKEKAAAEKRKRKIAEQFQEMKRDSEKITEEIGARDGPRDRQDRRRDFRDHGNSRGGSEPDRFRNSQPSSSQENGKNRSKDESFSRTESGEISGRDRRDHQDRDRRGAPFSRPSSPARRDRDRSSTDDRMSGRGDAIEISSGKQSDRRHGAESWRREEGLGGRWQRSEAIPSEPRGRSGKRNRAPSPEPGNDGRGERLKRPRLDETRRAPNRRRQRRG